MSTTNKLTGKASKMVVNGVTIAVKKLTAKGTRDLADTTDTTDYDATTDMLWPSQLGVKASVELSVEGWYNLVTTPTSFVQLLFTGIAAANVALYLNATTVLGHGLFDISDFSADVPVDDTVSFSATFKSNGVFTTGS